MKAPLVTLLVCTSLGAAACSSDASPGQHTVKSHTATRSADAAPAPPADASEWQTLMTGDWTLAPGTEGYTCVRKTITEDMYVKAFEAIIPLGTHHTLLTMGDPDSRII